MKIRPVGAEYFRVDRRTDMTKLIFAFRNFANASNVAIERVQVKVQCRKHFITRLSCSVGKHVSISENLNVSK
jgi:hypothetical protein